MKINATDIKSIQFMFHRKLKDITDKKKLVTKQFRSKIISQKKAKQLKQNIRNEMNFFLDFESSIYELKISTYYSVAYSQRKLNIDYQAKNLIVEKEVLKIYELYKSGKDCSEISTILNARLGFVYYIVSGMGWKKMYAEHKMVYRGKTKQPQKSHIKIDDLPEITVIDEQKVLANYEKELRLQKQFREMGYFEKINTIREIFQSNKKIREKYSSEYRSLTQEQYYTEEEKKRLETISFFVIQSAGI